MLEQGLELLGLEASGHQLSMLERFLDELEIWNSRLNLVGSSSRDEIIIRHVLDCAAGSEIISALTGQSIADAGTGAGFPGMVLAILQPDRKFHLIERSSARAGFLRNCTALLGLRERVAIIESDISDVSQSFDIVTLRAFREFGSFYLRLRNLLNPGGKIAAYKGRMDAVLEDLDAAGLSPEKADIRAVEVPFLDSERHMLIV